MGKKNQKKAQSGDPKPAQVVQSPASGAPVLYIHPAKQGVDLTYNNETGRAYGVIPVGLPALVNLLRANDIQVIGISYPLERQLTPHFNLDAWCKSHASARVVLIDLHWYEHCFGAMDTAKAVRQALPDAWIVMGGLTASGFAKEILRDFPEVDFIIRGDAEKPLLELVQRLLKSGNRPAGGPVVQDIPNLTYRASSLIAGSEETPGGETCVVENPLLYTAQPEDLDRLDFTDMTFLEHYQHYYVHEYIVTDVNAALKALEKSNPYRGRWLSTARGCRSNCSYCGGGKASHKHLAARFGLIRRSPARMLDDLKNLEKAGVVQASMAYDIAEMGEDYWRELFALMRRDGVKIGLYNEFFQLPTAEFIEDFMNTANLEHTCIAFSPLAGNERVRRLNGKHYSNDAFIDILSLVNQYNLHIFVYFSLNLPGETNQTFRETITLARQIFEFYPTSLLQIFNTVHTVDPFSPMGMFPEKFGIHTSMSTFQDYYNYCYETRFAGDSARSEMHRGFVLNEPRDLEAMADAWDAEHLGKEAGWRPIPAKW